MIVILYKTQNQIEGTRISHELIKSRLCNSIDELPVLKSFSYVDGKVEEHQEVLLLIKTKALLYSRVEKKIKELTSDENPKMYSLPMTQIDENYRSLLRKDVIEV